MGGLSQQRGVVGIRPTAVMSAVALEPSGHSGARIGDRRLEDLDGGAEP